TKTTGLRSRGCRCLAACGCSTARAPLRRWRLWPSAMSRTEATHRPARCWSSVPSDSCGGTPSASRRPPGAMSLGRYALGAACLVVVLASLALAATNVRRRWLPEWTGAPARLAEIVIGLAVLVAILELLGTIGWFELAPIVAACAAAAGASVHLTRGDRRPNRPQPRAAGLVGAVIAVAVTLTVAAEWTGATLQSYDVGIRTFDSVWYHLPWAASFAQSGHIAPLRFADIEYLTAFYPATAEMLHGLGIVLLGHDTLSPVLNLIWAMLVLLAAWCVGRARGAGAV